MYEKLFVVSKAPYMYQIFLVFSVSCFICTYSIFQLHYGLSWFSTRLTTEHAFYGEMCLNFKQKDLQIFLLCNIILLVN